MTILNEIYYGRAAPMPERRLLRAGPLTLTLMHGDVRHIRLGDHEIVRRIYVAVRDRNWGTMPLRIETLQVEQHEASFSARIEGRHQANDVHYTWTITITGDAAGTIRYQASGEAQAAFLTNRVGICVLHPVAELIGQEATVEKASGGESSGHFPALIDPHQPFMDIRAITYPVAENVRAELRFEGDIFEMEDQRNWTDSSFKTYSGPLDRPFPVQRARGERIDQAVTLMLRGDVTDTNASRPANSPEPVPIRVEGTASIQPLRMGSADAATDRTPAQIEHLRALKLAHVRADLKLDDPGFGSALAAAAERAQAIGAGLELAVHVPENSADTLSRLKTALDAHTGQIARVLVFPFNGVTASALVEATRSALGGPDGLTIGGGDPSGFVDLNRSRPDQPAVFDVIAVGCTPQIHAFDDVTILENAAAQGDVVRTINAFAPGVPVAFTPIHLAANPGKNPVDDALVPGTIDVRQRGLIGAAWTLASLKSLIQAGAASATYYTLDGLATDAGVNPLFHVLADMSEFDYNARIDTHSFQPLALETLALRRDQEVRWWLANMDSQPVTVTIYSLPRAVYVRALDETTYERATREPGAFRADPGERLETEGERLTITLRPFAVARIIPA
jgi:hypothetical protein